MHLLGQWTNNNNKNNNYNIKLSQTNEVNHWCALTRTHAMIVCLSSCQAATNAAHFGCPFCSWNFFLILLISYLLMLPTSNMYICMYMKNKPTHCQQLACNKLPIAKYNVRVQRTNMLCMQPRSPERKFLLISHTGTWVDCEILPLETFLLKITFW